jgi:hypothetical protein
MTARIAAKANKKARVSDEIFDEFLAQRLTEKQAGAKVASLPRRATPPPSRKLGKTA